LIDTEQLHTKGQIDRKQLTDRVVADGKYRANGPKVAVVRLNQARNAAIAPSRTMPKGLLAAALAQWDLLVQGWMLARSLFSATQSNNRHRSQPIANSQWSGRIQNRKSRSGRKKQRE
jgi:hypothetical protein